VSRRNQRAISPDGNRDLDAIEGLGWFVPDTLRVLARRHSPGAQPERRATVATSRYAENHTIRLIHAENCRLMRPDENLAGSVRQGRLRLVWEAITLPNPVDERPRSMYHFSVGVMNRNSTASVLASGMFSYFLRHTSPR
jgi:hypothetical protein